MGGLFYEKYSLDDQNLYLYSFLWFIDPVIT